jgi:hypothetical protein
VNEEIAAIAAIAALQQGYFLGVFAAIWLLSDRQKAVPTAYSLVKVHAFSVTWY